jgi:hypothetical protein
MLMTMKAAITASASLIKTCLSGGLGLGDRALGDITQFPTKSLTIFDNSAYVYFLGFLSLLSTTAIADIFVAEEICV